MACPNAAKFCSCTWISNPGIRWCWPFAVQVLVLELTVSSWCSQTGLLHVAAFLPRATCSKHLILLGMFHTHCLLTASVWVPHTPHFTMYPRKRCICCQKVTFWILLLLVAERCIKCKLSRVKCSRMHALAEIITRHAYFNNKPMHTGSEQYVCTPVHRFATLSPSRWCARTKELVLSWTKPQGGQVSGRLLAYVKQSKNVDANSGMNSSVLDDDVWCSCV